MSPPPQLRSIGSIFCLFKCAIVIARRLFSYIRVNCCWISWTPIFLIVDNFLSKTFGNCATISCYVINKLLGLVGRCLLWQKSESGWKTVNFITTLSHLCIIFKVCKKVSTIILPLLFWKLTIRYGQLPSQIRNKKIPHTGETESLDQCK